MNTSNRNSNGRIMAGSGTGAAGGDGGGTGRTVYGDYSIEHAHGVIYRGVEQVGVRDVGTGEVRFLEGRERWRVPVGKLIKAYEAECAAALPSKAVPVVDSPEAFGRALEAIKHTITSVGDGGAIAAGVPVEVAEPEGVAVDEVDAGGLDAETVPEAVAPTAPETDWRGDLTPSYLAWFWVTAPDKAREHYATRAHLPVVARYFNG